MRSLRFLPWFVLAAAAAARADELPERLALSQAPQESPWKVEAALYLWAFSTSGEVATSSVTADVDIPFSDAFEALSLAVPLHAELWRKDKFGIVTDLNWTELEAEPVIAGTERDLGQTIAFLEALLGYRACDEDDVTVDLLVGVRWVYFETDFDGPFAERNRDTSLIDPVIGMRVAWEVVESFSLWFRADVGGFGVGTDMSGNLLAGVRWRFAGALGLMAGYRSMAMEYEREGHLVDLRLHGPFLGFDVAF
jgi:hypothetical protein